MPHKCAEKCFSVRYNPFETINIEIEQIIADLMIRGGPNEGIIMGKYQSIW